MIVHGTSFKLDPNCLDLCSTYVNDMLHAGAPEYFTATKKTRKALSNQTIRMGYRCCFRYKATIEK